MTLPLSIQAVLDAADRATPGPWKAGIPQWSRRAYVTQTAKVPVSNDKGTICNVLQKLGKRGPSFQGDMPPTGPDALFIAASRNAVADLRRMVAEHRALQELLQKALERLERHHGPFLDHPPCPTCEVIAAIRAAAPLPEKE